MDCLNCKDPDTRVVDSMDRRVTIERERSCGACGATFNTTEAPDRKTMRVPAKKPPASTKDAPVPGVESPKGQSPPGKDPAPPAEKLAGGVGGGSAFRSGSGPDPDRSGSARGEDPGSIWKARGIWSPHEWQRKYGLAWTGKYKKFYGMPSDAKGCSRLGSLLELMPIPETLEAQARSAEMFRAFLASDKPAVKDAKHPFSFFVTEFGGLRVEDEEPPRKPGPLDDYS